MLFHDRIELPYQDIDKGKLRRWGIVNASKWSSHRRTAAILQCPRSFHDAPCMGRSHKIYGLKVRLLKRRPGHACQVLGTSLGNARTALSGSTSRLGN